MDIQPSLLGKIIRGISAEPAAFLICNKVGKEIKTQKLEQYVWPISYKKGNLTLGVSDSFFIALFRAQEIEFLEKINEIIKPAIVKKIFYRFSAKKENNF